MAENREKHVLVQAIKTLLDELSGPDLTIARANVLRPELARLMANLQEGRGAGSADRAWSPCKGMDAAPNHPFSDLLCFPAPLSLRSVG
jgi:hypothetical protein